jgi:2-polyprenyl-6-methoxyphenol hydroxylase-like FAD-dependent oxidoreductase
MSPTLPAHRYDVVIAGARVAGASTALLLARAGLRVLVVDPTEHGRDTLSTHALMRAGVMQLSRWGLLDRVRASGSPTITATTFHYGSGDAAETIRVAIEPDGDVDGLYAPRRYVLDAILADAAREAGADVRFGWAVTDVGQTPNGHVTTVLVRGPGGVEHVVTTDVLIGADGLRSRVARLVEARPTLTRDHATASIYGYWPAFDADSYHWYFNDGLAAGAIPTNDGMACVFVSLPPDRFSAERTDGLAGLFDAVVGSVSPTLHARLASTGATPKLRGFAGVPGMLRQSAGPGWALVGDAGYFKDPLTAHGMTDALRDAELLARAILEGRNGRGTMDDALADYQRTRDALSIELLDVTDRVAALTWSKEGVMALHRDLSRAMQAEVHEIRAWDELRSAA